MTNAGQRETWAVESADGAQLSCIFESGSLGEWRETLDRLFGVRYGSEQHDRYVALNTHRIVEARK